MTQLYFVRHAQPSYRLGTDSTYALSEEGRQDRMKAAELLYSVSFDAAVSSPYRRSIETIRPLIDAQRLSLETDDRLRERDKGEGSNHHEMFRRRWADFSYHEKDGECLADVQTRNMAAVNDILKKYCDKTVLIGTHGTALSTIIHYYDHSFGFSGFMRIIDYIPYVIRFDYEGQTFVGMEELLYVAKEYHGVK